MATKKVYFYKTSVLDARERELDLLSLKDVLGDIIGKNSFFHDDYWSLDISPLSEPLHFVWDVFQYKHGRLFFRLSKQKPNSSFIQREYSTYEKSDILPSGTEKQNGIEIYTFGSLEYSTGLCSIVSSQGAPGINALENAFTKYKSEYKIEFVAIPNLDAIQSIYNGERPNVSQVEVEIPLPSLKVLESVFGWNEKEILNVVGERNLLLNVTLKGQPRTMLTNGTEETQGIIDQMRNNIGGYLKAKLKGKTAKERLRDYNFFEENFSYPIDILDYHVENYERIYYTVDELVEIYRQHIINAYYDNEKILKQITGR